MLTAAIVAAAATGLWLGHGRLGQPGVGQGFIQVEALADGAGNSAAGIRKARLRARLSLSEADRHTALGDTIATADAFLMLVPMLAGRGLETFGAVLPRSASTGGF